MSDYYDRQGNPIDDRDWETIARIERHVALTSVAGFRVSTCWLGLDHSFGGGPPLIFETMVFRGEDHDAADASFEDVAMDRYSTEQEAIDGHAAMVARVEAGEFA